MGRNNNKIIIQIVKLLKLIKTIVKKKKKLDRNKNEKYIYIKRKL